MNRKVLAIDDSESNLILIRSVLEAIKDLTVITCADADMAKDKIEETRPDLILLDLMMPGVDGYTILKWLKNTEQHATIPVIVLSARHDSEASDKAMALGCQQYLKKPLSTGKIVEAVNQALKEGAKTSINYLKINYI